VFNSFKKTVRVSQFLFLPLLPNLGADRAVWRAEGRAKPIENRLRYNIYIIFIIEILI